MNYILSFLILAEGKIVSDDRVTKLPGWGDKYTGAMYSGYIPINASCNSSMYYWALEKEGGSEAGVTPILLWLNGGPGASSITGLLTEISGLTKSSEKIISRIMNMLGQTSTMF